MQKLFLLASTLLLTHPALAQNALSPDAREIVNILANDIPTLCQKGEVAIREKIMAATISLAMQGKLSNNPQTAGAEAGQYIGRNCQSKNRNSAPKTVEQVPSNSVSSTKLPTITALNESTNKNFLTALPPKITLEAPISPLNNAPILPLNQHEFGLSLPADLTQAMILLRGGNASSALALLEKLTFNEAKLKWVSLSERYQALVALGRAADAILITSEIAKVEKELFKHDANARAMRGLARIEIGEIKEGANDLFQVAQIIDSWHLPLSFNAPPPNILEMRNLAQAQLRAYTGMALAHSLLGNLNLTKEWAESAEKLYNGLFTLQLHPTFGSGGVSFEAAMGRAYNLALLNNFKDSGDFFKARKHAHGQLVVLALSALSALANKDHSLAEKLALEGESLSAAQGLSSFTWRFALERGKALLAQGKKEDGEKAIRFAQEATSHANGALGEDEARLRFGSGKEEITRILVRLDRERGNWDGVLANMEEGRARAFAASLGSRPLGGGKDTLLIEEIRKIERQIRDLRLRNGVKPTNPGDEEALLDARNLKLAALKEKDPERAAMLGARNVDPIRIKAALKEGEVLAYSLPGENVEFLLFGPNQVRVITSEITQKALKELLARLIDSINKADFKTQAEIVKELGRKLRIPDWGVRNTLYVVPGNDAYFIPWGALAEIKFPVIVLPNASWLLRNQTSQNYGQKSLILGDPDFEGKFEQLPGARKESEMLGKFLNSKPLLGKDASEINLRQHLKNGTEILHLATHGVFDSEKPLNSGIILAKGEMLSAAKLFANPLNARLAVLSACETGVGKATAGDDFLGLLRSFYLGGSVASLSSLWPVDDEGTQKFMRIFYENAKGGDFGAAWLAARDALNKENAPPFITGAFILGGAKGWNK